jgi:hypothetical protein
MMHGQKNDRSTLAAAQCIHPVEGAARHRSFSAAPNALLPMQSALSRHVHALERLLGVQLFERKRRSFSPTKAGQRVLHAAVEYPRDDIGNERAPMRWPRVRVPRSFATQPARIDATGLPPRKHRRGHSPHHFIQRGSAPRDVSVAVAYSKQTVTDLATDLLWPVRLSARQLAVCNE